MSRAAVVSVVVPVFNAAATIERSFGSLMAQGLKEMEVILVNDASTDSSLQIIERLVRDSDRIVKVIDLPTNHGVHSARMIGVENASAEWIGFLDADDYARTGMFGAMYDSATALDADIVVCGSYRVDHRRKVLAPKVCLQSSRRITDDVFKRFCAFEFGTGMMWNKLYRKTLILPHLDLTFPWRQDTNEDLLFNIACFHQARSVFLMKEMLHEYVIHGENATSNIAKEKAYVDIFRAYAVAVSLFFTYGRDAMIAITNMYRVQLSWNAYLLENVSRLYDYERELNEATQLILDVDPLALSLLMSRVDSPSVSMKEFVAKVVQRVKCFFSALRWI